MTAIPRNNENEDMQRLKKELEANPLLTAKSEKPYSPFGRTQEQMCKRNAKPRSAYLKGIKILYNAKFKKACPSSMKNAREE